MAAKRLNIDWDSAAEIEADDEDVDEVVPPAVVFFQLSFLQCLDIDFWHWTRVSAFTDRSHAFVFEWIVQGYSALYLVTLLPVIIGISVVLILFYNSLQ